jgi:hypothetical protein
MTFRASFYPKERTARFFKSGIGGPGQKLRGPRSCRQRIAPPTSMLQEGPLHAHGQSLTRSPARENVR